MYYEKIPPSEAVDVFLGPHLTTKNIPVAPGGAWSKKVVSLKMSALDANFGRSLRVHRLDFKFSALVFFVHVDGGLVF